MTLIGGHLTGLFRFSGRENRQPFWLWVLISWAVQMVVGVIVMIPLMMPMVMKMQALTGTDPDYLNAHPEIARRVMSEAMAPMFLNMMLVNVIFFALFLVLLAAAIVRRLHDSGRSGWWAAPQLGLQVGTLAGYAIVFPKFFEMMGTFRDNMSPEEAQAAFAPMFQSFVGVWALGMIGFLATIVLIVFLCLPGTAGPNRYGEDPLALR